MPSDRILHYYLIHQFGTDIYNPDWRPDPSIQRKNRFAYRVALIAPSILRSDEQVVADPTLPYAHGNPTHLANPKIKKCDMFRPSEINEMPKRTKDSQGRFSYAVDDGGKSLV